MQSGSIWISPHDTREATALNLLYRDVTSYPEPYRGQLQKLLADYTQYVIHEAWPLQRRGIVPRGGLEHMSYFQKMLTSFEPQTEGQKILAAEALSAYNRLIEARLESRVAVGDSSDQGDRSSPAGKPCAGSIPEWPRRPDACGSVTA